MTVIQEEVIPGTYVSDRLSDTAIHGRCQSRYKVKRDDIKQCELIHGHTGRHAYLLPSRYPFVCWWDDEALLLGPLEQEAFNRLVRARDYVQDAMDRAEFELRALRIKAQDAKNDRLLALLEECDVDDFMIDDVCKFPFDDSESDFAYQLTECY
ncbi:hypothetical protein SEA_BRUTONGASTER_59 [Gordonia phage BrutonGaster]|uniref:Uncharacterized protein n=1 Tax=Gordonia phage BrutonGaster TaxID=2530116 RepID=A0A482JKL1_9CAUD|nr:hypothetical protein HOV26_gp123 [Gordonia phage BrutonGaster]QBP33276.1 hypothetical protein SEA_BRUTONGASTER_59 [Gordonia phage BrutonGaster]